MKRKRPSPRPRPASVGTSPAGGRIEALVFPSTCYAASDRARPRWRFLLIAANRTRRKLTLRRVRITQSAGRRRRQSTLSGAAITPYLVQGSTDWRPDQWIILDVQEPGRSLGAAGSVRVDLELCRPGGRPLVHRHRVPLIPRDTQYLHFPLAGAWTAGNARPDLHCLGTQFGFDFVRSEDMRYLDDPSARGMRLSEFASFGKCVTAPAAGTVVAVENGRPDFPATVTVPTFPDGPPKDQPRSVFLGNYVVIQLDSGGFVHLAHLQQGSVRVAVGRRVKAGAVVGRVGNSGNTCGPHLHMEVLDAMPDLEQAGSIAFRQSGVPFGFLSLAKLGKSRGRRSAGRMVPAKDDVVARIPRRRATAGG